VVQFLGPITDELHLAAAEGKINPSSVIHAKTLPAQGIPYGSFRFVDLTFAPDIREFIDMRRGQLTTVLSGPNNSGKTLVLKLLRKELGPTTNLLACNRFQHVDRLSPATTQPDEYIRRHDSFVTQLFQQRQNTETIDFQLQQVLSQMKNAQRQVLWDLCKEMLGEEFHLAKDIPDNDLSSYYVDVGGENLAVTSTGTRLLVMIIATSLDDRFSVLLIDEPELGLSPSLQAVLSKYLLREEPRQRYFPHIKQVFVATHSHLFLDRSDLTNNFVVTKTRKEISIRQVDSVSAYHDLEFNMLGNDLEALFLPAAILIVEGPTDRDYIKSLFRLLLPHTNIAVIASGGGDRTKDRFYVLREGLVSLTTSPYRERIFILLDQRHTVRVEDFTKHGVPTENVIILDKNGLEYYYPLEILSEVFHFGSDQISSLRIDDNTVSVQDVTMTKTQLCQEVIERLTPTSRLSEELLNKLIAPVRALAG
jgi:ABC-type branched-subunit amino acid transport system ATPase component